MKKLFEKYEDEDSLLEMSNLGPSDTGLAMTIFVSQNMGVKHGPRIKVFPRGRVSVDRAISISISGNPRIVAGKLTKDFSKDDIKKSFEFIVKNEKLLLQFWSDLNMGTSDFLSKVKKV